MQNAPASSRSGPGRRPWLLEIRSSKALIVSTVSIAVFSDMFLYGVIVPVAPFALQTRAGVAPEDTQYWVSVLIAVYGAFLLAASPVWGFVSDRTSTRRAPLLLGLLVLAAATGMLCAGTSIALWIVGRALQGTSSAVVWTSGLALLVDTVGQKDVAQYLGYVSLGMSLGLLVAPLLGGVVFDKGGYYAVFAMCFALLGVDIFLRVIIVEKKVAKRWIPVEDDESEPASEESKATETEADTSAAQPPPATVTLDKSRPRYKLPPIITLLSSRRLLAALWAALVQASLFTAFDSTLPIYVRGLFHWTSLGAGLIFLPVVLPTFLAPLIGLFSDRYGPRWFTAAGFLLTVIPLVLLRFVYYNALRQKVLLCALLAVLGTTVTMTFPPVMAEVSYVVDAKERARPGLFGAKGAYAQAYGLFNVAFAGGCLIGPLWGGLIVEATDWGTMGWTLALLSGVTAIPSMLMVGGWIGGGKEATRRLNRDQDIADYKAAEAGRRRRREEQRPESKPSASVQVK